MALLIHPRSPAARPRPIAFSTEYETRDAAADREIVERILVAYHTAVAGASPHVRAAMAGTVWGTDGFDHRQAALISALEERSPERLHGILRQFLRTDAAHGLGGGRREFETVADDPAAREYYGFLWLDRLVGLAFAAGALPLPNPEDNPDGWARCLEVDVEAVAAALERRIGLRLEFPEVCGAFGGELYGRPFPFVALTHLCVALQIRGLLASERATILEIGGGWGGLTYFVQRLCPGGYAIYDLPFVNAIQAYFLSRVLPQRRLRLAGEARVSDGEIAILPAWMLLSADGPPTADLAVNQDSMPEIPRETARGYLRALRKLLRGPFLSVNHESWQRDPERWDRTSVAQLTEEVGGWRRVWRAPFPLRLGYVQELYCPAGLSIPLGPADGPWARLRRLFGRA